jgi:cyclopropane fatty-acyl-phospholipid synthase-like methyltransferase
MKHIKLLQSFLKEAVSLKDLEDENSEGTLGKNNQIYTRLYDYHMNVGGKRRRENAVGWLAPGSQKKNFLNALPYLEEGDKILDFGCGLGDFTNLVKKNLSDFEYVGVDINPKFITNAKKRHPDFSFFHIENVQDINDTFDKIVAIGVFTWFITKEDFIKTINHLYSICKDKVIITCIHSSIASHSWDKTYRGYDEKIFQELFPDIKMEFIRKERDLIVVLTK